LDKLEKVFLFKLYSKNEAARLLGIEESEIIPLLFLGKIFHYQIEGVIYIPGMSILHFISGCLTGDDDTGAGYNYEIVPLLSEGL
jgi:hypothetical protein